MKTTHTIYTTTKHNLGKKNCLLLLTGFACCILGAGLAASRRCAIVGHAAPYLIFFLGVLRASDTHARVGKGSTRVHILFLGDFYCYCGIGLRHWRLLLLICDCLFVFAFAAVKLLIRPTTTRYDIYTRPDK
jgi:hypothetical protein